MFDNMAGFGALLSAIGGGGDRGNSFPQSDAEDFAAGARFIPFEVTGARREGQKVTFVHECSNPCCWYWLMPNGSKIYHWERFAFEAIARANGLSWTGSEFHGDAGACPQCKNKNTKGGTVRE